MQKSSYRKLMDASPICEQTEKAAGIEANGPSL